MTKILKIRGKDPLVRIAKRDTIPLWRSWLIRLAAIALSLVICSLIINSLTGAMPGEVARTVVNKAFGTVTNTWTTIRNTMILFCVALAITPAFMMRFWNIGAEGQILMGGLVTAIVMMFCSAAMPAWQLYTTMIAASIVAGAAWGIIPAIFKAKWETNETLFTLMMNYIAMQLVSYCNIIWEQKKGSGTIGTINGFGSENYGKGWISTSLLSNIFGNDNFIIVTVLVLAIAAFIFIYMNRTKHGYEIQVVGESENTARYAGISVTKVIIRTMLISGAICGLAGFILVSGSSHTISTSTADGRGFTAIIVSWLGKFNVFYMALVSFMLVFLDSGASQLASAVGLKETMADVLVGIILFFILGSEFFINYRLIFRSRRKEENDA